MTGQAWLGDVARAAVALNASSAADWRHIAACLGLGAPHPAGPHPEPRATPETHPPAPPAPSAGESDDPARPAAPPPPRDSAPPGRTIALTPVEHRPPAATGWTVDPLPPPAAAAHRTALAHDPLLAPRTTAAVLHAALARSTFEGELDVEAAVDRVSRLRPLTELPRRPVFTLRYGVQILADVSASMEPLARDVTDVVARVRALAGVAGTRTLYFSESPLRGAGEGPRAQWRPYRVPPAGTTVLILSSLGLTGPVFNPHRAAPGEWLATVRAIRAHGCRPVALVPAPERHWPRWLRATLPAVVWDRGTTVGRVLGTVR
ncbi:hypothetical protein ABZ442_31865 [Streptomyces triculaminicus]|uniref:hypothetical protein n=1 Tax=Streptomyces triculaminicus TaxID=2816232 RepID=UPI0033D5A232